MEEDLRITTARNRVFETKNGLAIGKSIEYSMQTIPTSIYRATGMNQVKDILACGYVRPREGKLSGGHKNEVFWSRGSNKLYYFDKGMVILEVPIEKLEDNQIGAIPFEDLSGIWQYNQETNKYENRIEFYQKVYTETHGIGNNKAR